DALAAQCDEALALRNHEEQIAIAPLRRGHSQAFDRFLRLAPDVAPEERRDRDADLSGSAVLGRPDCVLDAPSVDRSHEFSSSPEHFASPYQEPDAPPPPELPPPPEKPPPPPPPPSPPPP